MCLDFEVFLKLVENLWELLQNSLILLFHKFYRLQLYLSFMTVNFVDTNWENVKLSPFFGTDYVKSKGKLIRIM